MPAGAVEERLERMRNLAVQLEPVDDGGAEMGMVALIDFVSTRERQEVRDGSATDYQVELGTGRLLDGLETAIVGMREGETREATTVLPDEADKKFAGKEAVFTITLKELKRRHPARAGRLVRQGRVRVRDAAGADRRHRAADPRAAEEAVRASTATRC